MRKYLFVLTALLLFSACREKSTLENQVMEIHDEVMPKLGKLNKQKRNLKKAIPSILDESVKKEVIACIKSLEAADEGMMTWMNDWDIPEDKTKVEAYLSKEMVRIKKVRKDMLSSMETATQLQSKLDKK